MKLKRLICGLVTAGALAVGVGCGSSAPDPQAGDGETSSTTSQAVYARCAPTYRGNCAFRYSCGGGSWYLCEVSYTDTTTTLRNATGTGHWVRILWGNNTFSDCKWIPAGATNYFFPNRDQWGDDHEPYDIQDC